MMSWDSLYSIAPTAVHGQEGIELTEGVSIIEGALHQLKSIPFTGGQVQTTNARLAACNYHGPGL